MKSLLLRLFAKLFARPLFYKMHRSLYFLSLRGLGILNYQGKLSGEFYFLKSYLKSIEYPLVIDVGANEGDYTEMILNIAPKAIVHAIEPHPATFGRLQQRWRHKNVQTINTALGMSEGSVALYDYSNSNGSGHASIFEDVIRNCHTSVPQPITVPMIMLDTYLDARGIDGVTLLKIDVEGNELAVLKGAEKSIRAGKINAIQFEFNEMNSISRVFFRDFIEFLADYDLFRLLPSGMLELNDYYAPLYEIFAYQNIVALRKSDRDTRSLYGFGGFN